MIKRRAKSVIRGALPMALRQRCAVWLDRQRWLPSARWWAVELVRDMAERDPGAYHRFLWTHHLGYADTYETDDRFGEERLHPTRRMLFDDLRRWLDTQPRARQVESVFEVGCSLGYLLRWMETDVFPDAARLEGIDVDRYAIRTGRRHLRALGSRARIEVCDMSGLAEHLAADRFDVILCCGVLMYAPESQAREVVRTMLDHAGLVVIAGLAHPEVDNANLSASERRSRDGSFIHNLDDMVARAGGEIVYRRNEGARMVDGNTVYFLFARRPGTERPA